MPKKETDREKKENKIYNKICEELQRQKQNEKIYKERQKHTLKVHEPINDELKTKEDSDENKFE